MGGSLETIEVKNQSIIEMHRRSSRIGGCASSRRPPGDPTVFKQVIYDPFCPAIPRLSQNHVQ